MHQQWHHPKTLLVGPLQDGLPQIWEFKSRHCSCIARLKLENGVTKIIQIVIKNKPPLQITLESAVLSIPLRAFQSGWWAAPIVHHHSLSQETWSNYEGTGKRIIHGPESPVSISGGGEAQFPASLPFVASSTPLGVCPTALMDSVPLCLDRLREVAA